MTLDGLNKQMRGTRPVSRQTVIILGYLEKYPPAKPAEPHRDRSLAKYFY